MDKIISFIQPSRNNLKYLNGVIIQSERILDTDMKYVGWMIFQMMVRMGVDE